MLFSVTTKPEVSFGSHESETLKYTKNVEMKNNVKIADIFLFLFSYSSLIFRRTRTINDHRVSVKCLDEVANSNKLQKQKNSTLFCTRGK